MIPLLRWFLLVALAGCNYNLFSKPAESDIEVWAAKLELDMRAVCIPRPLDLPAPLVNPEICTVVLSTGQVIRVECGARGCEMVCGGN